MRKLNIRHLPLLVLMFLFATTGVQAQNIQTVAGGGPNNVAAVDANLAVPLGVAVDGAGNFYIASSGGNRVYKVDGSGQLTIVAGNGAPGFSGDGGPATSASLSYPFGVAVDSAGNIYITDESNQRIRKVDTSGVITTVAGNGTNGYNGDNIAATSASLNNPTGVAVDSAGNLYITDESNQRIRKVDATTHTITTVAGNGTAGFSGDGGPATSASLSHPLGVAVDSVGNLYIADVGNDRIRKVDAAGNHHHRGRQWQFRLQRRRRPGHQRGASTFPTAWPWMAPATSISLTKVTSASVRWTPSGNITTVAGNGTYGYSGDGGPATSAMLQNPSGVAVDGAGNILHC